MNVDYVVLFEFPYPITLVTNIHLQFCISYRLLYNQVKLYTRNSFSTIQVISDLNLKWTSLAFMFCCPNSDHVIFSREFLFLFCHKICIQKHVDADVQDKI